MGDDKDTKDRGKRIVDLLDRLNSMPEYKLLLRIKSLDRSLYVFQRNFEELKNLLIMHSDVQEAVRLRTSGKRQEMRVFLHEVTRLLHNYVASVKSLIDHTRTIFREIYIGGEFPEYQEEVNRRFTQKPLAQFVQDLRDYSLHYELPTISSVLHFSNLPPAPVFESKVELKIEELNKYSNWSYAAKEYLSSQTKPISLLNVLEEYHALVIDFYKWINSRQKAIHSQALAKVASIQRELEDLEKNT